MRLTINGDDRQIEGASTIEELIAALAIHRMIVVEHNGTIVRRERYASTGLHDGDVVEIVHMVGGG
jgi:sulfur carrier protein